MSIRIHTPSAGGVIVHDGKVLVITSKARQTVDFPKGTIESGESYETTAMREILEETGYKASIVSDLGDSTYDFIDRDGIAYRKTVYYFLMKLEGADEPTKNLQGDEDFENEWLTPTEAFERLTHPEARELLSRAVKAM